MSECVGKLRNWALGSETPLSNGAVVCWCQCETPLAADQRYHGLSYVESPDTNSGTPDTPITHHTHDEIVKQEANSQQSTYKSWPLNLAFKDSTFSLGLETMKKDDVRQYSTR